MAAAEQAQTLRKLLLTLSTTFPALIVVKPTRLHEHPNLVHGAEGDGTLGTRTPVEGQSDEQQEVAVVKTDGAVHRPLQRHNTVHIPYRTAVPSTNITLQAITSRTPDRTDGRTDTHFCMQAAPRCLDGSTYFRFMFSNKLLPVSSYFYLLVFTLKCIS
jgi:hypothetical protein